MLCHVFWSQVEYKIVCFIIIVGEPVILIGDFNAKLGRNLIKSDIHDMSKNGKFLHELYTSAELELVNSGEKCKGTFTQINYKKCFEKSVLDYAFCSPSFHKYAVSLCIDESHVDFFKRGTGHLIIAQ